nr:peptide chain release factor N(5)-glutamine methyltransferase [Acidobacteriota bacterium]
MTGEQDTLSIAEAASEAARILRLSGVPEARREAASLLAYTISQTRAFLLTHPEHLLAPPDVSRFRQMVARRAAGEPLQYIKGRQEFFG